MISYFKFKPTPTGTQIFLRKKRSVFDRPKETYISKKANILITGIASSGKTKKIQSFIKNHDDIWNNDIINFCATDSITEIYQKNLTPEQITQLLGLDKNSKADINRNYIKAIALTEKAKYCTLIIDDIDKLTGKKLEITKDLIRTCKRFIVTAKDENLINKTLAGAMRSKRQKMEVIALSSRASVDATNILFAMFILALFASGSYELAVLVMAGRLAMRGGKR